MPLRFILLTARPIVADLAGTLAFYGLFLVTGSAPLAAAVGLALGLVQLSWWLVRRRRPPTLLLVGVTLTALLASVTIVTADPRFLLIKPTIVYAVVAASMLPRGWIRRYVPPIALEVLSARTLDRFGWAWAALLGASAVGNLLLVAFLPPRVAGGVLLAGGLTAKLLLFAGQSVTLDRRARRVASDPPAAIQVIATGPDRE